MTVTAPTARYRFAYLLPGDALAAKASPAAARLRAAWPALKGDPRSWLVQPHQGKTLAVWPNYEGGAARLEDFGDPKPCADGLVYFPSLVRPPAEDLIRAERERPPGSWWPTVNGGSLFVPLALATPRQLLIGVSGFQEGDYAQEFGRLAHEVYDICTTKGEGLRDNDPRFLKLIQETLRAGYNVTDEMIEDGYPLSLTTADINPILHLLFGHDPKASGAEPAPSPSAPGPTPTAP